MQKELIMSRESKILTSGAWGAEKTIYHYESFGWELLALNGNQITMSRETQNPVYTDLVKYQAKYEQLTAEYNGIKYPKKPLRPERFSFGTCLLLLLLLILPGAAYITYKIIQNNKYKDAMAVYQNQVADCDKKKAELQAEIDKITADSRATFFSKQ